jgi:hypothetical protein
MNDLLIASRSAAVRPRRASTSEYFGVLRPVAEAVEVPDFEIRR